MSPSPPTSPDRDTENRSSARWMARLSILCAFVSCTLNCVFSQIASRAGAGMASMGWLIDWSSLAIVLTGICLGIAGVFRGLRRNSPDTATIGTIGLVLNLGIVFVVVWYFAFARPAGAGP